jgi:hypothetical protein
MIKRDRKQIGCLMGILSLKWILGILFTARTSAKTPTAICPGTLPEPAQCLKYRRSGRPTEP